MSEQTSLNIAPEMVQITDPEHIADVWYGLGTSSTANAARELADKHKIVGMTLMVDLLEARAIKIESKTKLLNIGLAAKHGMDFTRGSLMLKVEGGRTWLYMLPLDGDSA